MRHVQRYAFHIAMSVFVVIMVVSLTLYQGFVNSNHELIGLQEWITPSFWQTILQQSKIRQPLFAACTADVSDKLNTIIADPNSEKNIIFNDAAKITLDCLTTCAFKLNNSTVTTKDAQNKIKLTTDSSLLSERDTSNLKIHWADIRKGFIIYEMIDIHTVYVISFNPTTFATQSSQAQIIEPFLQHDILLTPGLNQSIELVAVKRSLSGEDFIVAKSIGREELYVYAIQRKWLNKWKLPQDTVLSKTQVNDTSGCILAERRDSQTSDIISTWIDVNTLTTQ